MLVLSRKLNERIVVGGSVVVTVVRISGDKVRLGIEAPDDVRVIRDEIADQRVADHRVTDEDGEDGEPPTAGRIGITAGCSSITAGCSSIAQASSEERCFVA